jgi:hypothetical protein
MVASTKKPLIRNAVIFTSESPDALSENTKALKASLESQINPYKVTIGDFQDVLGALRRTAAAKARNGAAREEAIIFAPNDDMMKAGQKTVVDVIEFLQRRTEERYPMVLYPTDKRALTLSESLLSAHPNVQIAPNMNEQTLQYTIDEAKNHATYLSKKMIVVTPSKQNVK